MVDEVVQLRAQVRAQQDVIARLEDRITRLEADAGRPPDAEVDAAAGDSHGGNGLVLPDTVTDRRHLLSRAATVAAGAVVGGTALAVSQAAPAEAAQGLFDGNPAVSGTAVPNSGVGVQGTTSTGDGVYGTAISGDGVHGVSTSGNGVHGVSTNGTAVRAESTNYYAVYAPSANSTGVYGLSGASGNGVIGDSNSGYGVWGISVSSAGLASSVEPAGTHLHLENFGTIVPPPASVINRSTGDVVRDNNGDLWLCIAGGTPGVWRRVSGTNTAGALTLLPSPVRIYDSRPGNPPSTLPKTPLANGATRTLDCTNNASGVPVGATSVLANVTVVNTSANGFLVAYKQGVAVPTASTINWFQANTIVANTTVVACDTSARIACYVPPGSSTDFFVDVIGYTR